MSGLFDDLEPSAKNEQMSSFFYTLAAVSGIASPSFPLDKVSPKRLVGNVNRAYTAHPEDFVQISPLLDLSMHYNSLSAEKKQSRLLETILTDLEVDSVRFFEEPEYRDCIAYQMLESLDDSRVDIILVTLQQLGLDRVSLVCSHISWLFSLDSGQADRIGRFQAEIISSFEIYLPLLIPIHSRVS
jgi:hypothetical protein